MKRFLSIAAAIISTLAFASVANARTAGDEYVTRNFPVEDFTGLSISIPADIVYESGKPFLSISGPEKSISVLEVDCTDGKLTISSNRKIRNLKKISVIISSDHLKNLQLNGAAEFECEHGFRTDNFSVTLNGACSLEMESIRAVDMDVTLNGAGDIDFEKLNCSGRLKICVNGAGSADLSGSAYFADFKINGAGSIDAKKMDINKMSSSINGVGSISTR